MKRTKVVDAFDASLYGTKVNVKGWVRTRRGNKNVNFIAVNDGSTIKNIQVVVDLSKFSEAEMKPITTGACISVIGTLVESQGKGQQAEIQADSIELYGAVRAQGRQRHGRGRVCAGLSAAEKAPFRGIFTGNRTFASSHEHIWSSVAYPSQYGLCHSQIFQRSGIFLFEYSVNYG